MVKESTSIKKRRKNTAPTENEGETDIYTKVIEFEEKESAQRAAEDDANIYFDLCKNIRIFLADVLVSKQDNTNDSRNKIQKGLSEACVMIAILKKLNRLDKFRTITSRESLNTEKQKVDSTNLQYHNLLYEAAHLVSEYTKCKQFKSKDEDIELVPVETFLQLAPESMTQQFKTGELNDARKHQLHLAMLEWEKAQAQLCDTFEEEKKHLATDIVALKNRLEGIGPKLIAVLEASKPLQDYLGLPIDKIQAEHRLAYLLPEPLYLLYALTDAYKQVYNINMDVEILGDYDEANQWKELHQSLDTKVDVESEPENDQQEIEEIVEVVKKRRHRKISQVDKNEEKKKNLLESHPLCVQMTMSVKSGFVLKIKFIYRPQLNIVTVTSNTDIPNTITANTARESLMGESILNELLDGDFGVESPNPSNSYQLQRVGFTSFAALVPKLGYAYSWAQKICGYDFLAIEKNKLNKPDPACVELIIKSLYRRLKSRIDLALQLQQLEQNLLPSVPDTIEYPKNAESTLTKWASYSWQNYCQLPSTVQLIENEIVQATDLFYSATISRPKAILQAVVAIKNNYPLKSPIFSLTLKYNGEFHSGNSDEIRDMERAINLGWSTAISSASWILSAQFRHLCSFLDVYLESLTPTVFPQKTVFFKSVSGRNRRRPFKFRKIGAGIFT
ncbi:Fms-interacting protein/Thoc5 [Popillia japonica]|uniref:Fms-interacting protein/Thoc5 n=1 Tax=Popillia japonica TaxID=7064 RepID=A0AAW1KIX6_POPJA